MRKEKEEDAISIRRLDLEKTKKLTTFAFKKKTSTPKNTDPPADLRLPRLRHPLDKLRGSSRQPQHQQQRRRRRKKERLGPPAARHRCRLRQPAVALRRPRPRRRRQEPRQKYRSFPGSGGPGQGQARARLRLLARRSPDLGLHAPRQGRGAPARRFTLDVPRGQGRRPRLGRGALLPSPELAAPAVSRRRDNCGRWAGGRQRQRWRH